MLRISMNITLDIEHGEEHVGYFYVCFHTDIVVGDSWYSILSNMLSIRHKY